MDLRRKDYKCKVEDVNEKGIVTIAISKFDNIDSYGDIVRKGAFTKTFKEGGDRIKHVLDHTLTYEATVGLPIKMYETDTHAIVESALNLDKQKSRDLFSDYKFFAEHGKTLEHSYMYQTIKTNENKDIKGEEIAELKMYEYSTVNLGANPETPLIDLKSITDVNELIKQIEDLTEHLSKHDITDEQGAKIESLIGTLKSYKPSTDTFDIEEFRSQFRQQLNK